MLVRDINLDHGVVVGREGISAGDEEPVIDSRHARDLEQTAHENVRLVKWEVLANPEVVKHVAEGARHQFPWHLLS